MNSNLHTVTIVFTIIMLGCAVMGSGFLTAFFIVIKRRYQQKSWHKTYARITNHRILKKWYHIRLVNGSPYLVVLKEYEYEIFGTRNIRREELRPMLEYSAKVKLLQTPIGSTVEIYYNPQNPAESTMEPGIKIPDFNYLLYGTFCLLGAGILFDRMYL